MDSKLTPMMKQYLEIKKKHQNEILFFRMGDFYEMFLEDAHVASKILDIALTSRQNDIPMCGIPFHAAESYIVRLIKAGKRVAICEQMETVPTSGNVVKREVVRIITPGTVVESNLLPSDDNNFLASVIIDSSVIGMAFVDISTGDFFLSSMKKSAELFRGEITRFNPREIIFRQGESPEDEIYSDYIRNRGVPIYTINEWMYDRDHMNDVICGAFGIAGTGGLGIDSDIDIMAAGSVLQYLRETQKKAFDHLKNPRKILSTDRMVLDDATMANLEIVENLQDRSRDRTLFSVLNYTRTSMGRRTLARNLLQPLIDQQEIENRLDILQYFHEYRDLAATVQSMLKEVYDLERLIARFILGRVFPRNFLAVMQSLDAAGKIRSLLTGQPHDLSMNLGGSIPDLSGLSLAIAESIEDDPALTPEQGRVIRKGYNIELDHLYELKSSGKTWITEYQEEEKARLSLSSLKIKYNRILGYYIEVSKAQSAGVPEEYFRKQTLVGSERYTTEKLQGFESEILSAADRIVTMEKKEIERIRSEILLKRDALQQTAGILGTIDYYCSLATAAVENNLVRPVFSSMGLSSIREGRHPIVEKYYTREVFIPNDIHLDSGENIIKIITGPNMSGKSTYIRMFAIIQLMAQVGSFVPAAEAELTIADRIFTRIGASDNIARGESTFLVEMNETANILNNATDRSIIIMDEIGRGTSTYDGLSIAWAVVEYILRYLKARTLFATHYHELTQLEKKTGIVNYTVLVREHLSGVDFLHKVARGSADKSYGIHVARLAGIPGNIITRAAKILDRLEKGKHSSRGVVPDNEEPAEEQLEIFNASNHLAVQAIRNINPDSMTPLDALNELSRLKKLID